MKPATGGRLDWLLDASEKPLRREVSRARFEQRAPINGHFRPGSAAGGREKKQAGDGDDGGQELPPWWWRSRCA